MIGHFCPALSKAVKTMKKGEKVLLSVKPQCKLYLNVLLMWIVFFIFYYDVCVGVVNSISICLYLIFCCRWLW